MATNSNQQGGEKKKVFRLTQLHRFYAVLGMELLANEKYLLNV